MFPGRVVVSNLFGSYLTLGTTDKPVLVII